LKLLIISPSFWPALRIGGPVTSVFDLCRFLSKQGIDITVYTTNVYLENKIRENTYTKIEGIKIYYFGYDKYMEFMGETGWQYSLPLKKELKNTYHNFDIVYIIGVWNFPSTFAIRFLSKKKMPFIIAPHGALDPVKFSWKGYKKRLYYNLLLKRFIQNSFIHYFTSREAKKSLEFLNISKDKAIIIPNGIDIKKEKKDSLEQKLFEIYPQLKNKFLILYLGRLHPIKGIEVIIESLRYLNIQTDKIHLVIAGQGETKYESSLKSLVEGLLLNEKVFFTGFVEGEIKSALLSSCNIFVLLSYSEAFSISVLEAMSYSKAVIISDNCNLNVESENCGFISPYEPKILADKIELLFNKRDLLNQMGKNARNLVTDKYNWEIIVNDFKLKLGEIISKIKTT
jgi:glycosyltransferase involved in cell wall biosynthesis